MRNLDLRELEICPWALREGVVLKWMDWMESGSEFHKPVK